MIKTQNQRGQRELDKEDPLDLADIDGNEIDQFEEKLKNEKLGTNQIGSSWEKGSELPGEPEPNLPEEINVDLSKKKNVSFVGTTGGSRRSLKSGPIADDGVINVVPEIIGESIEESGIIQELEKEKPGEGVVALDEEIEEVRSREGG
jgi:hypothetical protein